MKYGGDGKAYIRKWLESKEPDGYDLREDTQDMNNVKKGLEKDFGEIDNSYERFWIYKFEPKYGKTILEILEECRETPSDFEKSLYEDKYKSVGDPDLKSVLLQEIYKILWPGLIKDGLKQGFMKKSDGKIASDAMTSVDTRFKDAMKIIVNVEKQGMEEHELKQICEVYSVCNKRVNQQWWTILFSIVIAALDQDFYALIDRKFHCMNTFFAKCFTVGNYCPVPAGFNVARSGAGNHDYWDLTLQKIHSWYEKKIDTVLVELLHNRKGSLENCKKWLEWFEAEENKEKENKNRWMKWYKENRMKKEMEGWYNFIDTLYLQDYVMGAENGDYTPKPFWEGHNWDYPAISYIENRIDKERKIEIINERLQEISIRITARSIRIVNDCRKKLAKT